MQRVNRATAVTTMPAPPAGGTPGFFTGGNPGLGQGATVPGFEWFNGVQEELIALISRSGIAPSASDFSQVQKSLDTLFAGGYTVVEVSSYTLTAQQAGLVVVNAQNGPITITLPTGNAANNRPISFKFIRIDATANSVLIERAGNDLFLGGGSLTQLRRQSAASVVSNGFDGWYVLSEHTALGRSMAMPGYITLPGGLIMQWGTVSGITGSLVGSEAFFTAYPTLPITFPNAIFCAFANPLDVLGAANEGAYVPGLDRSFLEIQLFCNIAGAAMSATYLAIGF